MLVVFGTTQPQCFQRIHSGENVVALPNPFKKHLKNSYFYFVEETLRIIKR